MDLLKTAREVFAIEARAILHLAEHLDADYDKAINAILQAKGRVVVCGMGKSGLIGKKIAATLASTGTPSFFMHPSEAFHGDLGMVTPDDVFIAISNSGETEELLKLMPYLTDNRNYVIALTGNKQSSLGRAANAILNISVEQEACPLQLAPTASTTATLAMGDAIAVTLMHAKDFQPEHFARFHPGGNLGRRLLATVKDEMIVDNLPMVNASASFAELVDCISTGQLGLAVVQSEEGIGITTDGDIRRAFNRYNKEVFDLTAADLMSASPKTINAEAKMSDAFAIMEANKITALIVMEQERVVGILKK
ncbi:KpsF/GutQ family sugar-phosphate isomerase [Neptunicella sp. SCSIO 80796]|uniref:KpsF/GutQ family sugar-phosphate isomerase n=1 Tax=Neptunicella plasticusilytica TaxID=3117012 RepID=UPI003A4D42FE